MLKYLFALSAFCSLYQASEASILQEMPREFYVKERWFSWTTTFDIETDQLKMGTVHRKFLSLSPARYDFYDTQETLQASATMRWFSWGATFDVVDAGEAPIGTVEQRIFSFFPTFEIHSPANHVLAIAKMNFWGTTYTISDPVTQVEMATLSRPFFRLKDDWTVTLTNPDLFLQKQIDLRLFILVMAFQTDREAWEAARRRAQQDQYIVLGSPSLDNILPKKALLKVFQKELKAYRLLIGDKVSTEEELIAADKWLNERLAEVKTKSKLERIWKGFKQVQPLLDRLTLEEQNALLTLFENILQDISSDGGKL